MMLCCVPLAQVLTCVDKDAAGRVTQRQLMGVQYVPLVHGGKKPPAEGPAEGVGGGAHPGAAAAQAREE
jgi:hypothetical protein